MSKVTIFKQLFLDASEWNRKIQLPHPLAYTSGDGIFRSDGEVKNINLRFHKLELTTNYQT